MRTKKTSRENKKQNKKYKKYTLNEDKKRQLSPG